MWSHRDLDGGLQSGQQDDEGRVRTWMPPTMPASCGTISCSNMLTATWWSEPASALPMASLQASPTFRTPRLERARCRVKLEIEAGKGDHGPSDKVKSYVVPKDKPKSAGAEAEPRLIPAEVELNDSPVFSPERGGGRRQPRRPPSAGVTPPPSGSVIATYRAPPSATVFRRRPPPPPAAQRARRHRAGGRGQGGQSCLFQLCLGRHAPEQRHHRWSAALATASSIPSPWRISPPRATWPGTTSWPPTMSAPRLHVQRSRPPCRRPAVESESQP